MRHFLAFRTVFRADETANEVVLKFCLVFRPVDVVILIAVLFDFFLAVVGVESAAEVPLAALVKLTDCRESVEKEFMLL